MSLSKGKVGKGWSEVNEERRGQGKQIRCEEGKEERRSG